MAQTYPSTELIDTIWPEDLGKRRNNILFLWVVLAWFWLVMGTSIVTTSIVELQKPVSASPDLPKQLIAATVMIVFSLVWAAMSYAAFRRNLWAMRVGICLSFVGCSPFLLLPIDPLYRLAALGEFLTVAAVLILAILLVFTSWRRDNQTSNTRRVADYGIVAVLLTFCVWRVTVSEHSQEVRTAFSRCCLFPGALYLVVPYVNTCRKLWFLQ